MKTSISTLKVNQKAQKAVDTAESSIKKFAGFLNSSTNKVGKDIPGDSAFKKAENFLSKFKGKKKGGGGGGKMIMGAVGAMMMLPMLLSKGNKTKAEDLPTDDQFAGDEKVQQQQIKEEEQKKTEALKNVEETVKTGKEISKGDLKQLKEVKTDEKKEEESKEKEARDEEKEKKDEEQEVKSEESEEPEEEKKEELTGDIKEEQLTRFSSLVDGLKSRFTQLVQNPAEQENVEGAMNVKSEPTVEKETGSMEVKGEVTPEMAEGGWIEGPQSGYPVSLDGKGVDFIGHGKEYVSRGPAGSAFIVPFDTPATRKDPSLTGRRMREAKNMGFSTGGKIDSKKFFDSGGEFTPEKGKKTGPKLIPFTGKIGYRYGEVSPPSLLVSNSKMITKTKETHNSKVKQKVGKEFEKYKEKEIMGEDGYYGYSSEITTKVMKKFENTTFEETQTFQEQIADIAIRDLEEHQQQLMEEIKKVPGFEKKTFIDVINGTVNMPLKQYIDILNRSDAARATYEKKEQARRLDRKEHGYNVRVVGGGFAAGGLWMPFSKGGFYTNMDFYPEYAEGGAFSGGGNNIMIVSKNQTPMPSKPVTQPAPTPDAQIIPIGSSDTEVFSSFLFNELGAS
jgi:hypothetical protein